MEQKINSEEVIKAYNSGESMNQIAKRFSTYPTTIRRILKKNNIELRHDITQKGSYIVKDGEKLIEWAKAQDRLVTKKELAELIGTKRLSPSYFLKYPELGQYVITYESDELRSYSKKLYNWLQENHISYKPNDRTELGVMVTALLLGDYSDIALQLYIQPQYISKKQFEKVIQKKLQRAKENKIKLILVSKNQFKNLDCIKEMLLHFK